MRRFPRKQLNRLIQSARDEFPPPEGLTDRVRASLDGVPRAPRRRAVSVWKLALASAVVVGVAAVLMARFHAPGPPAPRVAPAPRQDLVQVRPRPPSVHVSEHEVTPPPRVAAVAEPIHPVSHAKVAPKPHGDRLPIAVANLNRPLLALIGAHASVTDGSGKALRVGARVPAGAVVRTGTKGRATFVTRRGSEFTLDAQSELALAADGRGARLRRGHLYCRNRQHEFTEITTSAGEIRLLGTALDAEVQDESRVAVTVVEGQVELANAHGEAVVEAGRRALLVASLPPDAGAPTNVVAQTAWYDGRGAVVSDYGRIAYHVYRGDRTCNEIWTMNEDGTDRRRVKTYLGAEWQVGPWLSGQHLLLTQPDSLMWTVPDFRARLGHGYGSYGGAYVLGLKPRRWLVDASTGADAALHLPQGLLPFGLGVLSPDSAWLAFSGSLTPEPPRDNFGYGIWILDLLTGECTRLSESNLQEPSWAPDGSALAALLWQPSQAHGRLILVNALTGEAADLGVEGAAPAFSPDGNSVAYIGNFKDHIVANRADLMVMGISPGSQPRRLTPEGWEALWPKWSPDGTRILYYAMPYPDPGPAQESVLQVAAADGSQVWEVYRGYLSGTVAWAPSGKAIYVGAGTAGILLVAADGSGVIAQLGGTAEDSTLAPAQQADTERALAQIQEAMFQYALAQWRAYQGRVQESAAAFRKAADLFASLPWSCPNADLSVSNVMLYADTAQYFAQRPTEEVVPEACATHLIHLSQLMFWLLQENQPLPSTLEGLAAWARTKNFAASDWLQPKTDDPSQMLRCPLGDPYIYTPPQPGAEPKDHEVLLSCPRHPEHKVYWQVGHGGPPLPVGPWVEPHYDGHIP